MNHSGQWKPSASVQSIKVRARLLNQIRAFFYQRNITEVETPILSHFSGTEPNLKAIKACFNQSGKTLQGYLQTSPEYAMKRLLASGVGDCYQITKAFRDEESGRIHNPEFTLLEWYRTGFDDLQLLQEVDDFLQFTLDCGAAEYCSYQSLFQRFLDFDPVSISLQGLKKCAEEQIENPPRLSQPDEYLQLLFSFCIEPELGKKVPCFVTSYPASQASLARISADNPELSCRFEVFYKGVELANGFYELNDAEEQLSRFQNENLQRQQLGFDEMEIDVRLIEALKSGLPDCAGIALGIDRLLMLAMNATHIDQVIAFPINRA